MGRAEGGSRITPWRPMIVTAGNPWHLDGRASRRIGAGIVAKAAGLASRLAVDPMAATTPTARGALRIAPRSLRHGRGLRADRPCLLPRKRREGICRSGLRGKPWLIRGFFVA
jgi:hypothetical protein